MTTIPTLLAAALLAATVAACGDAGGDAPPGSPATSASPAVSGAARVLDLAAARVVSCGDAAFYVVWPDGEAMLTINVPGLAGRAVAAGGLVSERYASDDPALDVLLRTGQHLEQDACNDAIEFTPVVVTEARPVGGRIEVSASPNRERGTGPADLASTAGLTIEGVAFPGMEVTPARWTVTDLAIGWFVG